MSIFDATGDGEVRAALGRAGGLRGLAMRRRRPRRGALTATGAGLVVVALALVAILATTGGGGARRADAIGAPTTPGSKTTRSKTMPATTASSFPPGRYVPTAVVVPSPGTGILSVGGFSTSGAPRSYFWFERTADGGRSWAVSGLTSSFTAPAAQAPLGFVNAEDGWAGQEVVEGSQYDVNGPIGTGGVWVTHDGGRTWEPQSGQASDALFAQAGGTAWFAGNPASCKSQWCPTDLYATADPGAPLRPLAQPPGETRLGLDQLVRSTVADAAVLVGGEDIDVTTDGGASWTMHPLPARKPLDCGWQELAWGSSGGLWLTCQELSRDPSVVYGPSFLYRSSDLGRTWERVTWGWGSTDGRGPPTETSQALDGLAQLVAVNGKVAWATVSNGLRSLTAAIYRTVDGGRSWRRVYESRGPMGDVPIITVTSSLDAWASAAVRTDGHFVDEVLHTTDGGRHWTTTILPFPAGHRGR